MKKALVLLLAALMAAPALGAAKLDPPKLGDVPPDYVGQDFQDHPVSISAFKGKVVVVTFWASWCGPCRNEMNVLAKVQGAAGHKALEIVAVNFKEDGDKWLAMRRALAGLDLRITRDREWKVVEAFGIKSIPHMFMIDKTGHIAREHVGYGPAASEGLLKEINELLAQ